jgi:putative ABC transport system permease protein
VRRARALLPGEALRATVEGVLLRRHLGVKNFKVRKPSSAGHEQLVFQTIELLLLSTGFFSLFVGGINIMNVMLVTVRERTREFGVRRALGATPRLVLLQFLAEAAAVSLVGGAVGVVLGVGVSWAAAQVLRQVVGRWTFGVEPWSIALGLGLAVLTGIVSGILPARRAAALDPIEALRFE